MNRLDESGWEGIQRLGIFDIADLRSAREIARGGPTLKPEDIAVHSLPMIATAVTGEAPHEGAFKEAMRASSGAGIAQRARRFMLEEYAGYVAADGTYHAIRELIRLLGDGRPLVVHCFAGKDRTGFIVAVVLRAIGVESDVILADYMRSNEATSDLRERVVAAMRQRPDEFPEMAGNVGALSDDVLGVREEYLYAAQRVIDTEYGSFSGYLDAAGVTAEDLDRLRRAMLV